MITLKDLRSIPVQWNTDENKTARKHYAEWMMAEGLQKDILIFLDEFGVNVWTSRSKGRSLKGNRSVRVRSGQRGKNLTLCLAVSPQLGYVHHMFVSGGMTREHFMMMISEVDALVENSFSLLLDNARPHSDPPRMAEHHEFRFLPKYSPFLNAAEMAGSCVKAAAKRRLSEPSIHQELEDRNAVAAAHQTLQEHRLIVLRREMEIAIGCLTQPKCQEWFNHTMTYIPKCLREDNIYD